MKSIEGQKSSWSLGERLGLVSFLIAALLLFFDARLSLMPLCGFLLLSIAAPFFPRFSFFLPIISRGKSGKKAVALTFDDGPDPLTTPALLSLFSRYKVKATFFVTGVKAAAQPDLIKAIISRGHTIGNHTYSHDYMALIKNRARLKKEIESTQNVLKQFGIRPLVFRPPVGITSPILRQVLMQIELYTVSFSCRAFDRGNRRIENLSRKILRRVRPDDVILLHDLSPVKKTLLQDWLHEIELILIGLTEKGLRVMPLAELIGKPVMIRESEHISGNDYNYGK